MNIKEENICRLCLKAVAGNEFELMDEIKTKMLNEELSLKVNLDISKDPIICNDCTEILIKCRNFKSACVIKERKPPLALKKTTTELNNVFKIDKDGEIVDDNLICRLCSIRLRSDNLVLLNTLMNDVTFMETLRTLVPEMDFNVIKNSVICTSCTQDLERYVKFVENCLDVEEKVTKYCRIEGIPSFTRIKLNDVLRCSFQNCTELNYDNIYAIKREVVLLEDIPEARSELYNNKLIKTEEDLDIKNEAVNFNAIAYETPLLRRFKSETEITNTQKESSQESDNRLEGAVKTTFKCTLCAYETNLKSNLNKHTLVHKKITEVEAYKCSTCNFQTKRKAHLITHELVHKDVTDVEMYKCLICPFQTKYRGNLKNHTLTHKHVTNVVSYRCATCTFQTKFKISLKRHILIHKDIDVEIHKCSTCSFATKNKEYLKRHTLIHKNPTEVEVYRCSTCNFQTRLKSNLKNHILIHKDVTEVEVYKCSQCDYESKYKGNVKKHILIHQDDTQIDMYRCLMCTFQTRQKNNLKRHMLTHRDVAEVDGYRCSTCAFRSKFKNSLKRHMATHRDIEKV